MDQINTVISKNLKRLREERKLSLDALSKRSGVSKSMLAQIERGDTNPTITTGWKIANGLKISFTELITRPEYEIELVTKDSVPVVLREEKVRNYPLFPYSENRPFELFYIEFDPGAYLQSEAHTDGAQEFITVFSGTLEICVNEQELTVTTESAVRFKADMPHTYRNTSDEVCRVSMVISYPSR